MSLEIVPVERNRDLAAFVDVPWKLPDLVSSPQWVPPLRMMVRDLLDTKGNPFYAKAARALFIARRDGVPVGRIAAIENRVHNETHGDRVGFFGFFESRDDAEVAGSLVAAASGWLKSRGLTAMRGPVSPSTNHECGLLVDGFDQPQMFLTPWNPPFYESLLIEAGLAPIKNLLGYWLPLGDSPSNVPQRFSQLAQRAKTRDHLTFREMRSGSYWDDVALCWDLYNDAWAKNWGFVPMSRDEFMKMAKDMRPLLLPQFAFVAEIRGAPAGFMLTLPDVNVLFKKIGNGRLFPFGVFHILLGKSRLRTLRVMALGIREEFRTRGILPLLVYEAGLRAAELGATGAELSWVLEDNQAIRQPIEALGGYVYRRWRIFERAIA